MKMAMRLAALILVIAAVFWLWRTFFPSPELVIRHRLQKLARAASFSSTDGDLGKLAGARAVPDYFAPQVDVILDVPGKLRHTFQSREQISDAAMASRQAQGLAVKFPDINVVINGDGQTAVSDVTLDAHITGDADEIIEELQMTWIHTNDTWLIAKVQSVQPVSLQ
jgi:hypothetical protein